MNERIIGQIILDDLSESTRFKPSSINNLYSLIILTHQISKETSPNSPGPKNDPICSRFLVYKFTAQTEKPLFAKIPQE